MPIIAECPWCHKKVEFDRRDHGKRCECPYCGEVMYFTAHEHPPSHASRFVWWAQRHPGNMFPFDCPNCGCTVDLRSRVVRVKRKCPGCGQLIATEDIDRQIDDMEPQRRKILRGQERQPERGCAAVLLACGAGVFVLRLLA